MVTPIKLITTSEFYILLTLSKRQRHGYEIMQQVSEDSGGEVRLGPGTLYGSIKRMVEEQWIKESKTEGRRKYYQITAKGKAQLRTELTRYRQILKLAEGVI